MFCSAQVLLSLGSSVLDTHDTPRKKADTLSYFTMKPVYDMEHELIVLEFVKMGVKLCNRPFCIVRKHLHVR